ncbi:LPS export ABC transporter permease LptG [Salinispirillum sp. LH 10-3-1]|uniref:LPS export ABC transporter permease LptG n=1 Tax=Salinispirillum sp. LH 10-3-1 TaxID=2952525 RepID=A0AB38YJ40_9GAMM
MILSRYVLFKTLSSIFMVLLIFGSLMFLLSYADEMARRGDENFNSYHVLIYTLLSIPSEIYEFAPFVVMIGTLVSIGGLAASSELTAIRATGVSMARLLSTILMPALIATSMLFVVGEVFAPTLKQEANFYRADVRNQNTQVRLGSWYQSGNKIIHVGDFTSTELAGNLFLIELDDRDRVATTTEAEGVLLTPTEWQLENVSVTDWSSRSGQSVFTRQDMSSSVILPPISTTLIYNLSRSLNVLSLPELWQRVAFQDASAVVDPVVALRLWERLSAPLLTMTLSFIGIAFVFGSTRSISMGARIFMGVALGLVLQIAQQFFGPIGLFIGMRPAIAATLPVFLAFGLGVYLFRKNT